MSTQGPITVNPAHWLDGDLIPAEPPAPRAKALRVAQAIEAGGPGTDWDGLGNVCDACPYSPDAGAISGENCCGPPPVAFGACLKDYPGSIVWHNPGEAPAGLEKLGACARVDQGPCVGKVGRECLVW